MGLFEKLYTLLIFISIVVGMFIGKFDFISTNIDKLIVPLLIIMLYFSFLQIPISDLRLAITNSKFNLSVIIINFFWTPFFAWILATLFLGEHPALFIGFIMLMVTPCTDWYLVFTGIAKGNVALGTTVLPINLILQVTLLPVYIWLFASTTGVVEWTFLVESILLIVILPFGLAFISNYYKKKLKDKILSKLSVLPILLLCLAIVSMFASQGQLLLGNVDLLFQLMIPIALFFIINFMVGQIVGKRLDFTYSDRVSLNFTTLARNSPVALAIAITAFPNEPLIALTLVIGPLLELPILALVSQMLIRLKEKEELLKN